MGRDANSIAIARMIGCGIAVAGIGGAIHFGLEARKWDREVEAWFDAQPMELKLDLTTPSAVTTPFTQTCNSSHGEGIYVAFDAANATDESVKEQFAGLSGAVTIRDLTGKEILTREVSAAYVYLWKDGAKLIDLETFPKGDYTAEIRIDSGARNLSGNEHRIYARYELCGLEYMIPMLATGFAVVSGAIGLIAGVCLLPGLLLYGIRRGG